MWEAEACAPYTASFVLADDARGWERERTARAYLDARVVPAWAAVAARVSQATAVFPYPSFEFSAPAHAAALGPSGSAPPPAASTPALQEVLLGQKLYPPGSLHHIVLENVEEEPLSTAEDAPAQAAGSGMLPLGIALPLPTSPPPPPRRIVRARATAIQRVPPEFFDQMPLSRTMIDNHFVERYALAFGEILEGGTGTGPVAVGEA
eukprot:tig00000178_g12763.t1